MSCAIHTGGRSAAKFELNAFGNLKALYEGLLSSVKVPRVTLVVSYSFFCIVNFCGVDLLPRLK